MLSKRLGLGFLFFTLLLVGCTEVLSIPSVSVSEDGEQIAFLVQVDSGMSFMLQALNVDTGDVQRIGAPANIQGAFDWKPGRDSLIFASISPTGETMLQTGLASGDVEPITMAMLPENVWVNQISVSPDGTQAAVSLSELPPEVFSPRDVLDSSVDISGTAIQVLLVDIETGEISTITQADAGDTPSLDWNRSGTRLAFAFDGNAFVYDVASESFSRVNWSEDQSLRSPSWLNDTTLVMISAPDSSEENTAQTETEIVSFDVTSSATQTWVVDSSVAVVSASPDGTMIAYIQGQPSPDPAANTGGYATATTGVVLLSVDDMARNTIFVGESLDRPVWSPDSQTLYISNANAFSMFAGNRRQIFALDVASGATNPVFEGPLATSSLLGWYPPEE